MPKQFAKPHMKYSEYYLMRNYNNKRNTYHSTLTPSAASRTAADGGRFRLGFEHRA